jgi:hypothetical protein
MDPILTVAVRSMLTAQKRAVAAGTPLAPEDLEAYLREETSGKYGLKDAQKLVSSIDTDVGPRNVFRSAAQGATMNFGDELLGLLPEKLGGGKAGQEEMRLRGELFKNAHPKTDFVAGLAGAALPTLLAPEAEAASLGAAATRGAATGAIVGGLSGAGEGEDLKSRAQGAAVGGLAGTAFGAVLPSLVGSAKYALSPSLRASARIAAAIEKSGGKDAVSKSVADIAANGRGADVMLADASPHLRAATDFAANNSDDTLVPLAEKAAARKRNAPARLLDDVRQNLPGGDADAPAQAAQLGADTRAWAAGPDGYGGIRDANPEIDVSKIAARLNKPAIRSAWNTARVAGDITAGDPLDALMQKLMKANPGVSRATLQSAAKSGAFGDELANAATGERPVTFDDIHTMKEILDDKVTAAFKSGRGALGNAYKTVRDEVTGAMHDAVPNAAAVDAKYGMRKSLERALQDGQEAFHLEDTRGLQRTVSKLSPPELEQFRTGLASELITQLRSAATNRNAAARLVNASAALEDKLKVAFGTQSTFEAFMKRVSAENNLSKIESTFGNSATARRLQASGFDPAEVGVDAAITGAAHGPAGILMAGKHLLTKAARGAVTRNTAREMGPTLMTQGAPNIQALIDRFAQRDPLVGKFGSMVLPGMAGRTASSLFDY